MKKLILLSLILLTISLTAVQADFTTTSAYSAININDTEDDQIEFAASDKYIVYTNYKQETFSLYLYSIASGETILLDEQTEDKFRPSIDNNSIVWMVAANGKKYINHYSINSATSTVYNMPISGHHDTHPYINDNKISFIRWNLHNGTSNIMIYDIDTASLNAVDSGIDAKQTNQKHYNNTIVWQDKRNGIDEIFVKQIINEEEVVTNLSNNGLNHYFPKISEDNIIWDTKNSVYVKNLNDHTLQIIGDANYANFYSSIDGNNVVYQSKRNSSYDIYLYNLITKSETRLTNSYQNDEAPSIANNILTWRRQNTRGRYDVHYMNIKNALEKIYTKLNFLPITTTEVVISWPQQGDSNYASAMLYRSNTSTSRGMLIGDHLLNNNYTDTNLVSGNNYYYTLSLMDQNGYESTFSDYYKYTASNKKLVKLTNSPTVYLIDQDKSYIISNEDIFYAHNFKWSDITTISQRGLDEYHYSGPLRYPSGTLIKSNNKTVYLLYGEIARPFADEEIFIRAGYKGSQIKNIPILIFNTYTLGEELTLDNFIHPDNTLIKYTYNPNIYLIESNSKRLIPDENTFHEHGFKWANILTIPVYWEYTTGQNL